MQAALRVLSFCSLISAILLAVVATPVMAADDAEPGTLAYTIAVPPPMTRAEVKEIVAQSLAMREWTVQSKSDERVVGYLKHRGNEATTTFVLSDTSVQMYCVGYAIKKSGERKKPEIPEGWLANLNKDISKRLGVTASTK